LCNCQEQNVKTTYEETSLSSVCTLQTTRREFLKTSRKAAVGAALAASVSRSAYTAENNTIRVALVGCGGRGTGATANALATRSGPIKFNTNHLYYHHENREDNHESLQETLGNRDGVCIPYRVVHQRVRDPARK
jgi:hypothetical protein